MVSLIEGSTNKEATEPRVPGDYVYDLVKRYGVFVTQITTGISVPFVAITIRSLPYL
jgi:hypothetical protein